MEAPTSPYESLRRELLSLAPDAAKKCITDYLLQVSVEIMRLSPTRHREIKDIYLGRSLNQLGLDSLTAVAFRIRIKADLLVSIPFERFVGDVKIPQVASAIYDQILLSRVTSEPASDLSEDGETEQFTL